MGVLFFLVTVLWPLLNDPDRQEFGEGDPAGVFVPRDTYFRMGVNAEDCAFSPVGRVYIYGNRHYGSRLVPGLTEQMADELEAVRQQRAELERREREITEQLRQQFEADQRRLDADRWRLQRLGVLPPAHSSSFRGDDVVPNFVPPAIRQTAADTAPPFSIAADDAGEDLVRPGASAAWFVPPVLRSGAADCIVWGHHFEPGGARLTQEGEEYLASLAAHLRGPRCVVCLQGGPEPVSFASTGWDGPPPERLFGGSLDARRAAAVRQAVLVRLPGRRLDCTVVLCDF